MKRKKKPGLPRVTVLAYSKRDLVEFVQAVENLRLLVNDLRAVAVDLSNAAIDVQKKKGTKKPSPAAAAAAPVADAPPGARFHAGAPTAEGTARE